MPDREKVIFAIENCLTTDSVTECRKTECPFISCRESCLEWLLRCALALLKEQEAQWIPVTERLPEENSIYLVRIVSDTAQKKIGLTRYTHQEGWEAASRKIWYTVTHWMPLPEPPREEEDEA